MKDILEILTVQDCLARCIKRAKWHGNVHSRDGDMCQQHPVGAILTSPMEPSHCWEEILKNLKILN